MKRWWILIFAMVALLDVADVAAQTPTLSDVRRRALRHAGLSGPDNLWKGRAKTSALLPRVSARTGWTDGTVTGFKEKNNFFRDDNLDLLHEWTQSENERDETRRHVWSVQLTWDFSRLIFAREELAADARASSRRRDRLELSERVSVLFTRWKILKEATVTPDQLRERKTMAAILDALTDGWFLTQVTP